MAFNREEGTAQTREQEGGADFVKEEMLLYISVQSPLVKYNSWLDQVWENQSKIPVGYNIKLK